MDGKAEYYDGQTDVSRMSNWYEILDSHRLQHLSDSSSPLRVVSIGIGVDSGGIFDPFYEQPYEPYVLAGWAHCQKNDDYHLTLIDPHARAIPRVEQSLYIFVDANSLRRKNVSGSWLRLQQDLGSTAEQIHANDGSLSVLEPYEHTTDVGYAISKGMERIRVPNWFTSSVQAGRIKFFQKDIRDIRGISDQSLIFCLNVLLHYQQPEQEEMLTIMSSMLGKGKILVINEGKRDQQSSLVTDFRKQLFRKNGGWLEEEDLQAQFQLRIADTMDNGRIFLLEKV